MKTLARSKTSRSPVVVRLTRIVTKTGDRGTTALADGSRVAKNHPRIEAIGAVDELNSWIGLLRSDMRARTHEGRFLGRVQNRLFDLGAGLCRPGGRAARGRDGDIALGDRAIDQLEEEISRMNRKLGPLTSFILPSGPRVVCLCHVARTVCRRAERRVSALGTVKRREGRSLIYLNRLSDYLFVLARSLSPGKGEILWKPMDNA